jgi:hypothetical protein
MRSRPILSVVGSARIERPYYLCPACHTGHFPADVELDIAKTDFSPGVRRMLAAVGGVAPFAQGRDQIKLLAGLEVTAKTVERTAEFIGEDIEIRQQQGIQRAKQLRLPTVAGPSIPYLYVQMDGTQVFVVKTETEGRAGRTPGQPAPTRGGKLGAVFTQTTVDEKGRPVRDEDSTTYVSAIETASLRSEPWRSNGSRYRTFCNEPVPNFRVPVSISFFSDKGGIVGTDASQDGESLNAEPDQNKNALRTNGRSQGFYAARKKTHRLDQSGLGASFWTKHKPQFTESRAAFSLDCNALRQLRQARITVDSIDPLGLADSGGLRTSYYKAFLKGVRKPSSQVQFGNLGLQVLATQSGGLVLNSSNDIAEEIAKCVADANAFCVLSFEGLPGDGPDDYHSLDLKVDRPGVVARTRTSYYAQPEQVRQP